MKKAIYLILITALLALPLIFYQFRSSLTSITGMAVGDEPSLPPTFHQFYGTVNAADGTSIMAKVDSVELSTVVLSGQYGYSPLFLVENAIRP